VDRGTKDRLRKTAHAIGLWLVVFCTLGRSPHASWNVPAGLRKKILCPVFFRVETSKFPSEGSKSRIFGCFREELPPQDAGGLPRCAEYVKR
jgi:hypothetical protein